MILDTRATDVFLTSSIDGAPANWLTPSLLAAIGAALLHAVVEGDFLPVGNPAGFALGESRSHREIGLG